MLPIVLLAFAVLGCDRPAPVRQPIVFSHQAHVESGMECTACHEAVETAADAGVPSLETCMACHVGTLSDDPEEEKVREHAERETEIPWRRIYRLPPDVYFSHRRHVTAAAIECPECHGAVATLAAPASHPLVEQSMDWCLDCHEARGASTDCVHCHR